MSASDSLDDQDTRRGKPQITLLNLLLCVTVIAFAFATYRYVGYYGTIGLSPLYLTMLVTLVRGGTWREAIVVTLYIYALAIVALAGLFLLMLIALGINRFRW